MSAHVSAHAKCASCGRRRGAKLSGFAAPAIIAAQRAWRSVDGVLVCSVRCLENVRKRAGRTAP